MQSFTINFFVIIFRELRILQLCIYLAEAVKAHLRLIYEDTYSVLKVFLEGVINYSVTRTEHY